MPKIALKWMPKQRRVQGRPKKNWMEGIKKAMHGRNLNEGRWEDRKQWSLGVGQRRKCFETDIYIHTFHRSSILKSVKNISIETTESTCSIFSVLYLKILFHTSQKTQFVSIRKLGL